MKVYAGAEYLWLVLAVVAGWLGVILGTATAAALVNGYWIGVLRGIVLTGGCVLAVGYTATRAMMPPLSRP